MPAVADLEGAVLMFETSEDQPSAEEVKGWMRSTGERELFEAAAGVMIARPPVSRLGEPVPRADTRARLRKEQAEAILEQIAEYNREAVVFIGVLFGHTKPQRILPHGGLIRLDGAARTESADDS